MINDINNSYSESGIDKIIDFKKVYWIFKKYLKYIVLITFLSYFLGYLNYKTKPKTYIGQFQILVQKPKKEKSVNISNIEDIFKNRKKADNSLQNQILILRSKSVLLPLYEYIKSLRINLGILSDEVKFNSIKNNIELKVVPSTTVLIVSYKSKYQEEILPTLEKLSSLYQAFPSEDQIEVINDSINFYNNQIEIINRENQKTYIKIEELSNEYDLSYKLNSDKNSVNSITTNIEENTLLAATRIREIQEQINLLKEKKNNEFEFLALSKIIYKGGLSSTLLKENSAQLLEARSIFEEESDYIYELIEKRKYLYAKHTENVFNYLDSKMKLELAKIQSNKRPLEIINEYKRLIRKYQRQNLKINSFELQLDSLILQKAKAVSNWDLITDPRVLPNAVSPNKRIILTIYIFIGLFGSLILTYFLIRNKKIIAFSSEINEILQIPELFKLNGEKIDEWQDDINLFFQCNKEIIKSKKIRFVILGNKDDKLFKEFNKKIENLKNEKEVEISNKLSLKAQDSIKIFIILANNLNKSEVYNMRKKLVIQDHFYLGYIVIFPDNKSFYEF